MRICSQLWSLFCLILLLSQVSCRNMDTRNRKDKGGSANNNGIVEFDTFAAPIDDGTASNLTVSEGRMKDHPQEETDTPIGNTCKILHNSPKPEEHDPPKGKGGSMNDNGTVEFNDTLVAASIGDGNLTVIPRKLLFHVPDGRMRDHPPPKEKDTPSGNINSRDGENY